MRLRGRANETGDAGDAGRAPLNLQALTASKTRRADRDQLAAQHIAAYAAPGGASVLQLPETVSPFITLRMNGSESTSEALTAPSCVCPG